MDLNVIWILSEISDSIFLRFIIVIISINFSIRKTFYFIKLDKIGYHIHFNRFQSIIFFFISFILFIFSHNITFTPFTTRYKNKIIIIIIIIKITTNCVRKCIIDDSNKIFLVQRQGLQESWKLYHQNPKVFYGI